MNGNFTLQVYHMAWIRMIELHICSLSRGDKSEGIVYLLIHTQRNTLLFCCILLILSLFILTQQRLNLVCCSKIYPLLYYLSCPPSSLHHCHCNGCYYCTNGKKCITATHSISTVFDFNRCFAICISISSSFKNFFEF
jgi:hypothetical protein